MAEPPTELLRGVELFSELRPRQLREIGRSMKEHRYMAGRDVVTEGEAGIGFFVIAEGTAKVTVVGGEIRTLGPGDYFGEIALVADTGRTATVTASSDLTCWALTSWAFRPIVKSNPSIAWKLLKRMGRLLAER
jgi:CRP-like cAMP-binding protein